MHEGPQGVLPIRVGGATSKFHLPSLIPLSAAGSGRLQLGVANWASSVDYYELLIIDPTFRGSRFSTERLLAIENEKERKRKNLYSNEVHLLLQCVHTYN